MSEIQKIRLADGTLADARYIEHHRTLRGLVGISGSVDVDLYRIEATGQTVEACSSAIDGRMVPEVRDYDGRIGWSIRESMDDTISQGG